MATLRSPHFSQRELCSIEILAVSVYRAQQAVQAVSRSFGDTITDEQHAQHVMPLWERACGLHEDLYTRCAFMAEDLCDSAGNLTNEWLTWAERFDRYITTV